MHNYLKKILSGLGNYIWSLFLNGFFTILPITLTVVLFHVFIKLITSWLKPLHQFVEQTPLEHIPYAEVILVIVLIFAIGTILKLVLLRSLVHAFEQLLFKLPLIRPVYSGIKQLVTAFSIQDKITFKKVILVEFPRTGLYSLGFLTSELPAELSPQQGKTFFNVFIPTTPNPTSGYFIMAPESDIHVIDITRQEAMAMVISGGIIQPERFFAPNKDL